ncbi:MAG: Smr/MutS family protein [Armatimonadetes bacterium]|nr:Smr/MutS family protein [Armatimonadota bacterium]
MDKYLDDAIVAGLPRVTVVHGKGTGALRKAVHEFLAGHPHVKSYRLGERGEGDTGATVVELKES